MPSGVKIPPGNRVTRGESEPFVTGYDIAKLQEEG
jgi:hypothetical protein